MFTANDIPYQEVRIFRDKKLTVKRLDLVHPTISGNKFFKLKNNLLHARELGYQRILSFGGAYSNHIFALAHAAQDYNFTSVGIIRGDELRNQSLNPTLQAASDCGMEMHFVTREEYRRRHDPLYIRQLQKDFPDCYIIPEGGTNALAIKGCEEILNDRDRDEFDVICCPVGTGGTIAGIINASRPEQRVLGFSALKQDFLPQTVEQWVHKTNWQIFSENTFGGYGKYDLNLLQFLQKMNEQDLPLDPIYTGKMMYKIRSLCSYNFFKPTTRILVIHTGGLQALSSLMPYE